MRATVIGGSGYIGGEVVRLLLGHPAIELAQVTSTQFAGRALHAAHPNLRGQTTLTFTAPDEAAPCDVLVLPHGVAMGAIERWLGLAPLVIDLSADFRLQRPADYEVYYGKSHPAPEWLSRFVPGLPEFERAALREAHAISVPGCMANAAILALRPLAAARLISGDVIIDARTGSSGSGAQPDLSTHHAERSGVMRIFKPWGHRHIGEIRQVCPSPIYMTATAVEAVRGVQVVCHVTLSEAIRAGSVTLLTSSRRPPHWEVTDCSLAASKWLLEVGSTTPCGPVGHSTIGKVEVDQDSHHLASPRARGGLAVSPGNQRDIRILLWTQSSRPITS